MLFGRMESRSSSKTNLTVTSGLVYPVDAIAPLTALSNPPRSHPQTSFRRTNRLINAGLEVYASHQALRVGSSQVSLTLDTSGTRASRSASTSSSSPSPLRAMVRLTRSPMTVCSNPPSRAGRPCFLISQYSSESRTLLHQGKPFCLRHSFILFHKPKAFLLRIRPGLVASPPSSISLWRA